jgi:membrane associated rhomboid family serine protease
MDHGSALPPPPPRADVERCYRHPDVETGVHCTRCGRAICTECMIPAPVGHQCPECVAEARREFRRGPGRRIAVAEAKAFGATRALLLLIAGVYVLEVVRGGPGSLVSGPGPRELIDLGAQVPIAFTQDGLVGVATGQYWRLFTAMFLHAGILHAAMNSWVLYVVGSVYERDIGRLRFVAVYLSAGLFASAASYALTDLDGGVGVSVGASGAIFGLFGGFLVYNWRRRAQTLANARLRQLLPWVLLNLVITFTIPFIDWRAHIGGLVAGVAAGYLAEGVGRDRATQRLTAVIGIGLVLAATVALTWWGTVRIREAFPQAF